MGKRIPLEVRFWRKVEQRGDCWIWTGAFDKVSGYGRVRIDGVTRYAHRTAYELMVGEIPGGFCLDHLCRNRVCVNPYHLDPVTPLVNTQRGNGHGRETHCPQGHPYAGENLRLYEGRRSCRACNIKRSREWREANRRVAA